LRRNLLFRVKSFNPLEAMSVGADVKLESQVRRRQAALSFLGPFDQPEVPGTVVVRQSQVLEFLGVVEAVKVEVQGLHLRKVIGFQQGVAGTLDGSGRAERAQDAARERGFAGAEFTAQFDHAAPGTARWRRAQQSGAQRLGLFAAARGPAVALLVTQGFTQPRSSASTSLAISPRWPPCAAESPASACTSTPTRAASAAPMPWARSPAITPVSTSPMPAVAMPGLPRSQMCSSITSAGPLATSVPAPLSTVTAP